MDDLEDRLAEALGRHADDAPAAHGLAGAARDRAHRRRRARTAAVVAAAVLAVGVPGAGLAWPEPPVDPALTQGTPEAPDAPALRWETWHGVSVQVPSDWVHGELTGWCAGGADTPPRVQRPARVALTLIGCTPASTLGLSFQASDAGDFAWPVVHQGGGAYPVQNAVGGRSLGGVLITVAAPTAEEATRILDSARVVRDRDPLGCATRPEEPPTVVAGTVTVCSYDPDGELEQSEVLYGGDAEAAEAALAAMPDVDLDCQPPRAGAEVVRMRSATRDEVITLAAGCTAATTEVLYWAISPGFLGDVPGLPLPEHLREG